MADHTIPNTKETREARDLLTLSKKLEDILHDRLEVIADQVKKNKGHIEPGAIDAMVDETRDMIVIPVATYIRKSRGTPVID